MSLIKRNIFANLFGGAFLTLLTLIITPLQVNILGIEAYGLVGFITTLQLLLAGFDFGLASTLTREIAADTSIDRGRSGPLVRTASTAYWAMAVVAGGAMMLVSGQIARHWFNPKALSSSEIEQGLRVVALYLALRWPIAMYSGVLSGLQRMDVLNAVKSLAAAVRLIGGIIVLLQFRDLRSFLWWSTVSAFLEVVAYALAARYAYRGLRWRLEFSWPALKPVLGYSMTMYALAMQAIVVAQLDRLLTSKMLSLDAFGYYSLAYTVASSITLLISAVSVAVMPAFAECHGDSRPERLHSRYDNASRVVLYLTGSAAFAFVFFGHAILRPWVGLSVADGASAALAMLALGFWGSAAVSVAYSAAVATGHPMLPLRISLLCALPYVAGLFLLIQRFQAIGAAAGWVLLNVAYVLLMVPSVHRRVLGGPSALWFRNLLLPFALLGVLSFALPRLLLAAFWTAPTNGMYLLALVLAFVIYVSAGLFVLGPGLRRQILRMVLPANVVAAGLDGR